jgi:serine/threonine protein kinase
VLLGDFGTAQQFAVPGVAVPVRSALARAVAATSGCDSDTGRISDDDERDDDDRAEGEASAGLTSGDDSATSPTHSDGGSSRLSAAARTPTAPGWVTDTAGTFQFLAPEVGCARIYIVPYLLSSRTHAHTHTQTLCQRTFCPPFQACSAGGGYDAFSADVWAAGVCFYIMLFGVAPFGRGADGPMSLFDAIQSEPLLPLPFHLAADPAATAAAAAVIDLLCGLLRRDPATRLTIDEAVAHPFLLEEVEIKPFVPLDLSKLQRYSSPELAMHEHFAQRKGVSVSAAAAASAVRTSFSDAEHDDDSASSSTPPPPPLMSTTAKKRQSFLAGMFSSRSSASSPPIAAAPLSPPAQTAIPPDPRSRAASSPPLAVSSSRGQVLVASADSTVVTAAHLDGPVTMEGWLHKRGRTYKTWRRRYFQLEGRSLSYFDGVPLSSDSMKASSALPGVSSGLSGPPSANVATAKRSSSGRTLFSRFSRTLASPAVTPDAGGVEASVVRLNAEGRPVALKGRMDMTGPLTVVLTAKTDRPFLFRVTAAHRELYLQACSEADLHSWLRAFERVQREYEASAPVP